MGDINHAVDVLLGVQTVIGDVGEAVTVTRITQQRDPNNPTNVITAEEQFSVSGALMGPRSRFDSGTQTVRQVTEWYTDLLSARDSAGNYLNTIVNGVPSIRWVTQESDEVTLSDGTTFKLMKNEQPRISGIQCAAFHEVVA